MWYLPHHYTDMGVKWRTFNLKLLTLEDIFIYLMYVWYVQQTLLLSSTQYYSNTTLCTGFLELVPNLEHKWSCVPETRILNSTRFTYQRPNKYSGHLFRPRYLNYINLNWRVQHPIPNITKADCDIECYVMGVSRRLLQLFYLQR